MTERTLRRYVQRLIGLGIPIESERGPYGGTGCARATAFPR